jgi:RNA exonuclease 4
VPPFADLLSLQAVPQQSAPFFSVDVECVASGPGHNDRAMGHIAIVDQMGEVVVNVYVRPSGPVTSYLPLLTGLTEADCAQGVTEEEAIRLCRAAIPRNAVLVGQNVLKDVQWLRLEDGVDFESMRDLMGLFSVKNPRYNNSTTCFSLAHEAKALLSMDQQTTHHPAIDAWLSIKLYQLYLLLQQHPAELARAQQLLLDTPIEGAFNKKHPIYDGVCMGNRKDCKCGQPHFG